MRSTPTSWTRARNESARQGRPPGVSVGIGGRGGRGIDDLRADGHGKELRGEGLEGLAASLKGYFAEPYGLFLDGAGASLCEYWYLMNIAALAYGLIGLRFARMRRGSSGWRGAPRG